MELISLVISFVICATFDSDRKALSRAGHFPKDPMCRIFHLHACFNTLKLNSRINSSACLSVLRRPSNGPFIEVINLCVSAEIHKKFDVETLKVEDLCSHCSEKKVMFVVCFLLFSFYMFFWGFHSFFLFCRL